MNCPIVPSTPTSTRSSPSRSASCVPKRVRSCTTTFATKAASTRATPKKTSARSTSLPRRNGRPPIPLPHDRERQSDRRRHPARGPEQAGESDQPRDGRDGAGVRERAGDALLELVAAGGELGDPLVDPRLAVGGEDEVEQGQRERQEWHEGEQHAVRDRRGELGAAMTEEGGDRDRGRGDEPPDAPDAALRGDRRRRPGIARLRLAHPAQPDTCIERRRLPTADLRRPTLAAPPETRRSPG